jgi:hypothetical protein
LGSELFFNFYYRGFLEGILGRIKEKKLELEEKYTKPEEKRLLDD